MPNTVFVAFFAWRIRPGGVVRKPSTESKGGCTLRVLLAVAARPCGFVCVCLFPGYLFFGRDRHVIVQTTRRCGFTANGRVGAMRAEHVHILMLTREVCAGVYVSRPRVQHAPLKG